jgi:uncharacterized membrane protein
MAATGIRRQRGVPKHNSSLVLTLASFALSALGVIHLVGTDHSLAPDPSPHSSVVAFKLAGVCAAAGWLLEQYEKRRSPVNKWIRRWYLHAQAISRIPADGILEMLVGGLFFIIVLLLGMVSLWSSTVR